VDSGSFEKSMQAKQGIIIARGCADPEEVAYHFEQLKQQGYRSKVICLDYALEEKLTQRRIPYRSIFDYSSRERMWKDIPLSVKTTKNWYIKKNDKGKPCDCTHVEGISLGEIIELDFHRFFVNLLQAARRIRSLLEEEREARIFILGPSTRSSPTGIRPGEDEDFHLCILDELARSEERIEHLSAQVKTRGPALNLQTDDSALKWQHDFIKRTKKRLTQLLIGAKNLTVFLSSLILVFLKRLGWGRKKQPLLIIQNWSYLGEELVSALSRVPEVRLCIFPNRFEDTFRRSFGDILGTNKVNILSFRDYGFAFFSKSRFRKILQVRLRECLEQVERLFTEEKELDPFAKKILVERIRFIFKKIFPVILVNSRRLDLLFKLEDVRAVITGTDTAVFEKFLVSCARKHGIPSVLVQHGGYNHGFSIRNRGVDFRFSDYNALFGERDKNEILKHNPPPRNSRGELIVTGAPRFDVYRRPRDSSWFQELRRKIGIGPEEKVILYADLKMAPGENIYPIHHTLPEYFAMLEAVFYGCAKAKGELFLVVKSFEPYLEGRYFDAGIFGKIAGKYGLTRYRVIARPPIQELLPLADAVVVSWSTVGIEAIVCDKPLIAVNLRDHPDMMPYVSDGVALGVYETAQMPEALNACLYDDQTRQRLARKREELGDYYSFNRDGRATERVFELIRRVAEIQ